MVQNYLVFMVVFVTLHCLGCCAVSVLDSIFLN